MKKILHLSIIAIIAVGFFLLIGALGQKANSCKAEPQKKVLCGGYTEQRKISDEDYALFRKVMGESAITPISVATQVVAGLNYRFRCSYDGIGKAPGHCLITIYKPLQGEPVISKVQDEDGGPEMKVVIDRNGFAGRYIGEDKNSYEVESQDSFRISKDNATLETRRARDGQGILTLKNTGKKPVFKSPNTKSGVIGTMVHESGYIPEVYRCLGYIKGWFFTDVNGKSGFIQENLVCWDAINTF